MPLGDQLGPGARHIWEEQGTAGWIPIHPPPLPPIPGPRCAHPSPLSAGGGGTAAMGVALGLAQPWYCPMGSVGKARVKGTRTQPPSPHPPNTREMGKVQGCPGPTGGQGLHSPPRAAEGPRVQAPDQPPTLHCPPRAGNDPGIRDPIPPLRWGWGEPRAGEDPGVQTCRPHSLPRAGKNPGFQVLPTLHI